MDKNNGTKEVEEAAVTKSKEMLEGSLKDQKPSKRNVLRTLKAHKKLVVIVAAALLVILVGGGVAAHKFLENSNEKNTHSGQTNSVSGQNMGDADSLDPVQKGLASTGGKCEGTGNTKMTFAPMAVGDIGSIAPMGGFGGSHVTPIDHQYYYGVDQNAARDTYPVYATMDGLLTSLGTATSAAGGSNWNITLAHSCTFMIYYNLMTSIAPAIMQQVPSNWKQDAAAVKIAVKAGDIIGYVGGQSLDFELGDTTFTNPKLLNHTAYNNTEPFKINVVHPLDYFSESVKAQILPKYLRIAEPRDGDYAYDVDGQAVGNWFEVGTNGYAGGSSPTSNTSNTTAGHLALAYDGFDPSALVLSIGEYDGGSPAIFVVNDDTDWTKITQSSGVVKVQLAEGSNRKADGTIWDGGFTAGGITFVPTFNKAAALIQLTGKQEMKFEIFPGKTTAQISNFDANAVMYNRGQDAHMNNSTTASPSVSTKR